MVENEYNSVVNSSVVSVIMPCYNAGLYIAESIESVMNQTYPHWELLVVDDCSTDNSAEIIERYAEKDSRIRRFSMPQNSGSASAPRNVGISESTGNFIAFLDADDVWLPEKLEKQIQLAGEKDAALVYSYYEKIDAEGNRNNRIVTSPLSVNYKQLLKGNVIGCLTAMYSEEKLGKLYFEDARHEDFILWLEILKKGYTAYNLPEVLAYYRVGKSSLSSNKLQTLKWTWDIYRKQQKLSVFKSAYLFGIYALKAILKYKI